MSEIEERPMRKSVAFSEGTTIVNGNGEVIEMANGAGGDKESAQNHGSSDPAVDEVTDLFAGLAKKKKKKPKKEEEEDGDEAPADTEKVGDDDELDLSALKKKKKKKSKPAEDDDFEAKLKEAGEDGEEIPAESAPAGGDQEDFEEEAMLKGTGIWQHDATQSINYNLLLSRFFALLHDRHPDLAGGSAKSYKIPPPQCLREGNKKTIFANIPEISKRLKRPDEHITQFLFAELGTSGSVDGSRRLVIKGRFQSKQIENVLRRYIIEYVTCKTCKSPDTDLNKGENRLSFVTCNSCGSRRSVTAIKTGFSAQIGKRKRMQA